MTDPTVAERIAKELFRGISILEDAPGAEVIRYLTDTITTALAEARREVWEEAAKQICVRCRHDEPLTWNQNQRHWEHRVSATMQIVCSATKIQEWVFVSDGRRSRAHDAE